jgi:hypothetical protein
MRRSGELSAQQRSLLEIMREHQFGRLENMPVRVGQPVLDGNVRVVRVARLGGGNGMDEVGSDEYELKRPVRDLFDELARLGNGTVLRLEFRHGLPFVLETTADISLGAAGIPA